MWDLLFATITGLGLTTGTPSAPAPQPAPHDLPPSEPTAAEKLLAEPTPEPEYAFKGGTFIPTASPLAAFRSPGWSPPVERGLFATPLPGRGMVREGSHIAAPVITPTMRHGKLAYDVIPAGRVDVFDPVATRHPEDFVFGPASGQLPWRMWGSAEVLLGMTRGANVPPVVTTGPTALGFGTAGTLGATGTAPVFGGRKMLDDWRAGVRGEMGLWFDDAQVWGAHGRFYSLYSTSDQLVGGRDMTNVVAVPQSFPPIGPYQVHLPIYVAYPGWNSGSVWTTAQTNFAGGDLSVRRMLRKGPGWRLDVLGGYRQLHLGDELGVTFQSIKVGVDYGPNYIADASMQGGDSLRTRNNFFGAQVGGIAALEGKRWSIESLGAVALGVNSSELNYDRSRQVFTSVAVIPLLPPFGPGGVTTVGPLVRSGVAESTSYFGTVWEGGFKVGYRVGDHLRLTAGYTGMYWWNVRRAQEQFVSPQPLGLNLSTTGVTTDFFVHTFSWGAELRY